MKRSIWQHCIPGILVIVAFQFPNLSAKETGPLNLMIKRLVSEVRPKPDLTEVDSFLVKAPSFNESQSLSERALIVSKYLFETQGFAADASFLSRDQKDNILPDSVIKTKAGHCLGLSILYLLIAEKNQQDAFLVRAPDHVFVRFCKKSECINIETLKKGAIEPDQYYIDNLLIPKAARGKSYLVNLDPKKELAASIYLGLGFVAAKSKQVDVATLFYLKSAEHSNSFAEPHSNLAAVYFEQGQVNKAKKELSKALEINPNHYATLVNLGAIAQGEKKNDLALDFYKRAIDSNPLSYDAYYRRSSLLIKNGKAKEALLDLDKILVIQPRFCDVIKTRITTAKTLHLSVASDISNRLNELQKKKECLFLSK